MDPGTRAITAEKQNIREDPTPRHHSEKLRRWAWRILRAGALIYLVLMLLVSFGQNLLIYPGAYVHGDATIAAAPDREVLSLQAPDGRRVAAVFGGALTPEGVPRPDAATRPTIIYFYGNGDCIDTSMDQFEEFRRLGANVLIPEYIGYPMSGGKPSEAGIYATADAAYQYVASRPDLDPRQIVIIGRSLGSGAAIDLAARKPVAGLATFSAFTSMDEMARKVMPLVPTRLFLKSHFRNDRKIAAVACPIFLAHGTADDFVPFSMMARLAADARTHVEMFPIVGADHNSIFIAGGNPFLLRIGQFIEQVRQAASRGPATGPGTITK